MFSFSKQFKTTRHILKSDAFAYFIRANRNMGGGAPELLKQLMKKARTIDFQMMTNSSYSIL